MEHHYNNADGSSVDYSMEDYDLALYGVPYEDKNMKMMSKDEREVYEAVVGVNGLELFFIFLASTFRHLFPDIKPENIKFEYECSKPI